MTTLPVFERATFQVSCDGCGALLTTSDADCAKCGRPYPEPADPSATIERRRPQSRHPAYVDLVEALESIGKERRWFAEGAIEGDPIVVLAGAEKKCKSWILAQLAVATIVAGSWLGAFTIRRPGSVVVLDAEYGAHDYTRRLARIARAEGHDPRDVLKLIRYYSGAIPIVDKGDSDFGVLAMRDVADDPPAAIILDPFRDFLIGDENSAKDVIEAMRLLAILRDIGGCPVVCAHHLNRSGTMSGSRALKTRADLFIEGTDEDDPRYGSIGRTLRRGDKIKRPFSVVVEHTDDNDDTVAKTFVRLRFEGERTETGALSKMALRVLDVLRKTGENTSKSAIRKALNGLNSGVVSGALNELKGAGLVEQRGESWQMTGAVTSTLRCGSQCGNLGRWDLSSTQPWSPSIPRSGPTGQRSLRGRDSRSFMKSSRSTNSSARMRFTS